MQLSSGLEITGASREAVAAIEHYTAELLAQGKSVGAIIDAARAMPECAMVQACAASTFLYTQSVFQSAPAAEFIRRARERFDDLTQREQAFIAALESGLAGDFDIAMRGYEAIIERWPTDILSAKLAEFHGFQTGESARQLKVMRRTAEAMPSNNQALAMHAFALELCGRRDEADAVARRALEIEPLTMWAQHCLAHVYTGQGRIDEGIVAMRAFAPTWEAFSAYLIAHNSFHLAALHIARRELESADDLFRRKVWGIDTANVAAHTDAILLLWYIELAGGDANAGGHWRAIAPHIRPFAHEHLFPFLNAMYVYALVRAGESDEARKVISEVERYADAQDGIKRRVWKEVGVPLVRGCAAFASDDYDAAAAELGSIIDRSAEAGGSDEQRGVFPQSLLLALMKSGRKREARACLESQTAQRPLTALERHWAAQL
jgi:tetratricopeptide (TPR) repeat protein